MRDRSRRGSTVIETAILIPFIILLLVGMVNLARITYIYYTLRKTIYSIARYVGTQQGVNFCDATDPTVAAAINFGLTGTTDASQPVFVNGLLPSMIVITPEQIDPTAFTLSACPCGAPGCDPSQGGGAPDYIAVAIQGYAVPVRIPGIQIDPIPLTPQVQVPYGGT